MKELKRYAVFFVIGGVGYGVLELLWRGRTHPTMIVAGGICFSLFSLIAQKCKRMPLIFKALLCAVTVTAVELAFGVVFNLMLHMNVWDYSARRFHLWGQICPLYSLYWGALGFVFIPIAELLNKKLIKSK